jgi:hypothetical protein
MVMTSSSSVASPVAVGMGAFVVAKVVAVPEK